MVELTDDVIGNKIEDRIKKVSKRCNKIQNNVIISNEHDKKIPKGKYISPKERQKVLDNLR